MALAPVSAAPPASVQSAFGLDFQSLLSIILTQLTYQDPLKPIDNFQFVSQLGQFAQLQQTQSLNDQITNVLAAQSATQATSLLGRTVDISGAETPLSGRVTAISFAGGQPQLTITQADGSVVANLPINAVTQVR